MEHFVEKIRFSIITVCYNAVDSIKSTIESVICQNYDNFEYIIVDGGSSDGTVEIIKHYSNYLNKWISERDNGIYNAMNKATNMATGDYCLYMNSGDQFYSNDVLSIVAKFLQQHKNVDICAGIAKTEKGIWYPYKEKEISLFNLMRHCSCHQATFISTELIKRIPYDETLKIVSDSKFFIEALILNNASYIDIQEYICKYAEGGVSSNLQNNQQELKRAIEGLFSNRILKDIYLLENYYNPIFRLLYPIVSSLFVKKIVYKTFDFANRTKRKCELLIK